MDGVFQPEELTKRNISFRGSASGEINEESGLELERLYFNRTPHIATILNPDKTQLGFGFRGTWSAPKNICKNGRFVVTKMCQRQEYLV